MSVCDKPTHLSQWFLWNTKLNDQACEYISSVYKKAIISVRANPAINCCERNTADA